MRKFGNIEVGYEASKWWLQPWMMVVGIWYDARALRLLERNLVFTKIKPWSKHVRPKPPCTCVVCEYRSMRGRGYQYQ